jgi:uncharacterized protein
MGSFGSRRTNAGSSITGFFAGSGISVSWALTEFVYPGATHTRFEHSLGVMELATRAFDQLAARRGAVLETNLKKVAELVREPLAIARQLVRMAALLHDIGHACFSHAAETVIQPRGPYR